MMKTGFRGTFVISWSQTEIDGLNAASLRSLITGAAWGWHGNAIRVDGPNDVLRLDQADGSGSLRKRAARMVQRLVGAALEKETPQLTTHQKQALLEEPLMDHAFVVTDGYKSYTVTLIDVGGGSDPLLMFMDELPPRDQDLWVVHHTLEEAQAKPQADEAAGVICFTPGTRILTPEGLMKIEDLREGDLVETKDNGRQPIRWVGSRRMSGARLFAMPKLRPVRISAGFFADDQPDEDLLVSPEHRILLKGRVAQDLFNTSEVLVAAKDLVDGQHVTVDLHQREVTYVHALLSQHQIIWANGVETESFHPASAPLSALDDRDRQRLLGAHPELEADPHAYGGFARRNLTTSEAAILRHAA